MAEGRKKTGESPLKGLISPQNVKLLLFGLLGVACILAGTFLGRTPKAAKDVAGPHDWEGYARRLEADLEDVVGAIQGVGKVQAKVTLERGPKNVFAENVSTQTSSTEETTEGGTTRATASQTESAQPVFGRTGSQESLLVEEVLPVQVAGCLIVAEGAASSRTKQEIVRAVETLLAIPPHKIAVAPMKGGK